LAEGAVSAYWRRSASGTAFSAIVITFIRLRPDVHQGFAIIPYSFLPLVPLSRIKARSFTEKLSNIGY